MLQDFLESSNYVKHNTRMCAWMIQHHAPEEPQRSSSIAKYKARRHASVLEHDTAAACAGTVYNMFKQWLRMQCKTCFQHYSHNVLDAGFLVVSCKGPVAANGFRQVIVPVNNSAKAMAPSNTLRKVGAFPNK